MKKIHVLGIASLCMFAFGVFGIAVLRTQRNLFAGASAPGVLLPAFVLLGFVGLVGAYGFALTSWRWDDPHKGLPVFLECYRDALQKVFTQRWLLVLLGVLVIVNMSGSVLRTIMAGPIPSFAYGRMNTYGSLFHMYHGWNLFLIPLRSLALVINDSPRHFFPSPGANSLVLSTAGVLLIMPWVRLQLKRLGAESTTAKNADLLRRLLLLIGIFASLIFIGALFVTWRQGMILEQVTRVPGTRMPFFVVMGVTNSFIGISWRALYWLVILPILIGGIAGSMQRGKKNVSVTKESFFEDGVRHFSSVAGVFLLLGVAQIAYELTQLGVWQLTRSFVAQPYLSFVLYLAMAGLMFVPYAATSGTSSAKSAICGGVRTLFGQKYNLLGFVGVGITSLSIVYLLADIAYSLFQPTLVGRPINASISAVIDMSVFVIMAVAVWEFYSRVSKQDAAREVDV